MRTPTPFNKEHVWRWTWGWVVSVMLWPNDQWTIGRTPSHNPNSDTTGSPRMEPWTDGQMSCETHAQSTVMRVMHVKLASHSARGRYVVKAASQCVCAYLDRGLAMCFLKPSSLPQCVFAIRLRLPNVSSQCVCATQCVFTMRLRLPCDRLRVPMRLHNASALPNVSAPIIIGLL